MIRLSRLFFPLLFGICCLMGGTLLRAADPGAVEILRERVFDLYQRIDPPRVGAELPIRIVDIDDPSLATHGQWPWPRNVLADLVITLRDAGAAVIAFDVIFPEPDRTNPLQVIQELDLPPDLTRDLTRSLTGSLSKDEMFAAALSSAPSVLGVAISTDGAAFSPIGGFSTVGPPPARFLDNAPASIGNVPVLQQSAQGLGGIHVSLHDDDAVVRRIPALTQIGEAVLPGLFVEALRVAQGAQSIIVRTNPAPGAPEDGIPEEVRVGALTIPLTESGAYRIRYGVLDEAITLSANTVLAARSNPGSLADRVGGTLVLVGTSAPGLFDLRASPLGTIVPGVTMHAQAVANIISDVHLARPDWTLGLELTLLLAAGLIVIAVSVTLRPVAAAFVATTLVFGLAAASWFAFSHRLLLVDASYPIALTLLTYGAVTVPVLVGTDRQQRFIRTAFSHYLAEPVLARLERDPDALKLDGDRRMVTILFMDVRGFTSRSETMEPTDAVNLLNTLLDPLSEAVLAEEGTIDKFMGDGLMAFWNAPLDQEDHAARALRTGIAMIEAINAHNDRQPATAKPLSIGVGIHTGEAFIGNMGSKRRFAYSAVGDSVNLAARVETLAGSLSRSLLITRAAYDAATATDQALANRFESIGDHDVKGRSQPVAIYALGPEKADT